MARTRPEIKPTSPAASVALVLLALVSFIIVLWVAMAIVRIVVG